MIHTRYLLGSLVNIPLLPLLYLQAKQIRQRVPALPEASKPVGFVGNGSATIRLLSIGESTIAGVGVKYHKEGFTGHLAKLLADAYDLRVEWRVMAKSGYTAKRVRENLIPELEDHLVNLIVIGLGGNDTFKLNAPNKWRKDLHLLIDDLQIKFPETPIVFINVPPVRSFPAFTVLAKFVLGRHIDLLHEVLQEVVTERDDVWYSDSRIRLKDWINYWPGKTLRPEDFFSDGIHPSELTYKTWAGEVSKFIRERRILE
jgi:lysophospholipase L1-like esterase